MTTTTIQTKFQRRATSTGGLTDAEIRQVAPAVFTDVPADFVSDRYTLFPTYRLVDALRDSGWQVSSAAQNNTRKGEPDDKARHILRMRHTDMMAADLDGTYPEICLVNSHNLSRRLFLLAGFFKLLCSNGMFVSQGVTENINKFHVGLDIESILGSMAEFGRLLGEQVGVIQQWSEIELSREQQLEFVREIAPLRFNEHQVSDNVYSSLLTPRRSQDQGKDAWTVFNVAQEAMTHGGFALPSGRVARRLNDPYKDMVMNTQMWDAASNFFGTFQSAN